MPDYGAFEPIARLARKAVNAVDNLPNPPSFGGKYTSWHGDMVKSANEGFRKLAESKHKVGGTSKGRAAGKRKLASKSGTKKLTTKG
jgi:GMP synthase-like glutamine amidotransferase